MFQIWLDRLGATTEDQLRESIERGGPDIELNMTVPCLWRGDLGDIAQARLAAWFIGELVAECGTELRFNDVERIDGDGDFQISMEVTNSAALATKLVQLSSAFDPDVDDGWFDFVMEVEGWWDDGGPAVCRCPQLRDNFELDEEAFQENRSDSEDDDD